MAFRKLTNVSALITGSIESDTGSQYLFGYREDAGLQWLERTGIEYSPADPEWRLAEGFVEIQMSGAPAKTAKVPVASAQDDWDEDLESAAVQMGTPATSSRPSRVTRSVAGDYDMGATNGDVVG